MTTVAGIAHRGRVWIGADSLLTWNKTWAAKEPKVWKQNAMLFAATGCTRERDILQHSTTIPPLPRSKDNALAWLASEFVGAVREGRSNSGWRETQDAQGQIESGPMLLIGLHGRLFSLDGLLSVCEHDVFALGSGGGYAYGSLLTSAHFWTSPRRRITAAIEAAISADPGTGGPITIMSAP